MTNRDIRRPWPFQNKSNGGSSLGSAPESPAETIAKKIWRKWVVGNSGMPQKFCPSPELIAWLDEFRPQVLYTILGPIPHMEACEWIADRYGCSVAVHFMDDWYHQAYTTGIFRFQRRQMLRLFHGLVKRAALHLTICDRMTEEFNRRYSIRATAFQNTIDVEKFAVETAHVESGNAHARKILYFGSVLRFAQLEAIQFVGEAIDRVNKEDGTAHTLRVITSTECMPGAREGLASVHCLDLQAMNGAASEFAAELSRAEVLLLPANFSPESEKFLKFSMPTKIPGYLASGVPVLVFTPGSLAQNIYAKDSGWGLCAENSTEDCMRSIRKICSDESLRKRLSSAAVSAAIKNHDSRIIRTKFQDLIRSL
jgi:glycosyltransferase involved in cell wall biosynthesis